MQKRLRDSHDQGTQHAARLPDERRTTRVPPVQPFDSEEFLPVETGMDAFERVDTLAGALAQRQRKMTIEQPVIGELSFDTRVEINLYISRCLEFDIQCRVTRGDAVVVVRVEEAAVVARGETGELISAAASVPQLVIDLLDILPGN